jgi:transposase
VDAAADTLQQLEAAREQVRVLSERVRELMGENEALRARMDALCRRLYGKRSEHVDPAQLALAFAELGKEDALPTAPAGEPAAAEEPDSGEGDADAKAAAPAKRRGHGRQKLPSHLPRRRVEHEPAPEDRVCSGCSKPMARIGEEVSEQLDCKPASLVVVEHVRGKYACQTCKEGVTVAAVPEKLVEKGLAAPGLVAQVVTSKFADHVPLARQEGIYAREGVELSRSTLLGIVNVAADLLAPVARAVRISALASRALHADETTVRVRTLPKGSRISYFWTYVGRRPAAKGGEECEAFFEYTHTRSGDAPKKVLAHYKGPLQADAYSGYDECYASGEIIEVGCWAHARRHVYEALGTDPTPASALLALIAQLYLVERDAKDLDEAARLKMREERSRPLIDRIGYKVAELHAAVLPKGPLGKALGYLVNHWKALTRFLESGFYKIDNNSAERAIRHVAVGRRNWLIAGSDEGARRAATLYTLTVSCKLADVDPFEYLRDVLERLSTTPASRAHELTPLNWKAARDRAAKTAAA